MLVDPLTGLPAGLLTIVTVYWPSTPEKYHYTDSSINVTADALIPGKYSN